MVVFFGNAPSRRCLPLMSKQSEYLRDQARRASRLSSSVSTDYDCQILKHLADNLDADAERLERCEADEKAKTPPA